MTMEHINQALIEHINCKIESFTHSSGGMINDCYIFDTDKGRFFVKVNSDCDPKMFVAEKVGLETLKRTKAVRVPEAYYAGDDFIIMEYIELLGHNKSSQEKLGIQLAKMHLIEGTEDFGFKCDNTIGATPQINTWTKDWPEFFIHYRLGYQFKIVSEKYRDDEIRNLGNEISLKKFFQPVKPSLLHGDLWGGNTSRDPAGNPVIYDPAVYYGHHEADLSIASMFGGFTEDFYGAYHDLIPKEPGFSERQRIYQLYHYLNHYYLFGSGYREACIRILKSLQ